MSVRLDAPFPSPPRHHPLLLKGVSVSGSLLPITHQHPLEDGAGGGSEVAGMISWAEKQVTWGRHRCSSQSKED
ncbi:hypothetical protein E2C01_071531 [Portunus trituberculatus]|uniref:Uncharacterized protein n=1 Tax=Portunus trituberculatus TaxID=210409 RepID=A0A5B7I563_PORTR|nr:hypothetical protein [Portunus trituberculatus]